MRCGNRPCLRDIGPGIVMAATGLGAGDLITAAVSGASYGTVLLWAAAFGAAVKFVLNEGLTRWQLATGTTLLEGWVQRLPIAVSVYFLVYLLIWSFIVAGALIAATGLAAHAIVPGVSVTGWGAAHSIAAAVLVISGRYALLETLMKGFMALMFAVVLICAALVAPDIGTILGGLLLPRVPDGAGVFILGIIGGVGGSVTLLSYGYWIRERNWTRLADIGRSRRDLAVAYLLTGLFGIAIMIISAGVRPEVVTGSGMALAVADHLDRIVGPVGKWCFLTGFWAAVFSSMLGVWQGIPYLFTDFIGHYRRQNTGPAAAIDTRSMAYRAYLLYIAVPPVSLMLAERPVWLVVTYAVTGAFFMPLLAGSLLYMNNRRDWVGSVAYGWRGNLLLLAALAVFATVLVVEIQGRTG
jgi:Mn2+/Fe2+ NRAMP family transporter